MKPALSSRLPPKSGLGCFIQSLVILIGFICLCSMMISQWVNQNRESRLLGASLLAHSTADYSQDLPGTRVAQVELGIIGDMMRDSQPDAKELAERLATVTAVLIKPVPTATHIPSLATQPTQLPQEFPEPPTPTNTPPVETATAQLQETATNIPSLATSTPNVTSTPMQTNTSTAVSATSSPTANYLQQTTTSTPTIPPTATTLALATDTPSATVTPNFTRTPSPSKTQKPKNTHFPTKTRKPTKLLGLQNTPPPEGIVSLDMKLTDSLSFLTGMIGIFVPFCAIIEMAAQRNSNRHCKR